MQAKLWHLVAPECWLGVRRSVLFDWFKMQVPGRKAMKGIIAFNFLQVKWAGYLAPSSVLHCNNHCRSSPKTFLDVCFPGSWKHWYVFVGRNVMLYITQNFLEKIQSDIAQPIGFRNLVLLYCLLWWQCTLLRLRKNRGHWDLCCLDFDLSLCIQQSTRFHPVASQWTAHM